MNLQKSPQIQYDNEPVFVQGIAIVQKNGKYGAIVVGGKEIIPPIYDAMSEFENGIAIVEYKRNKRVINLSGQIQVTKGKEQVFLPDCYDWADDFCHEYAPVYKDNKWGLVNQKFELAISCIYETIEAIYDGLFKYTENGKCGLINAKNGKTIDADYNNIFPLEDGYFKLEKIIGNWQETKRRYGIANKKGEIIIQPLFYDIELKGGIFVCKGAGTSTRYWERGVVISYTMNGEVILSHKNSNFIVPSDYPIAYQSPIGLFRVNKDGKWGVLNQKKELIVPTAYEYIGNFVGAYAIVGKGDVNLDITEKVFCPDEKIYGLKYGLIDTTGEEILTPKYDDLKFLKDGYITVKKDGLWGLMSPTLEILIEPISECIEILDGCPLLVFEKEGWKRIVDYNGKEIWMPDYGCCHKIKPLANGLISISWDYHSVLINSQGKTILDDSSIANIKDIGHGLLLIARWVSPYYNIVNLQGQELFLTDYDKINVLPNGLFSLCKDNRWGIANIYADIIIDTKYENELVFENGVSPIKVKNSSLTHKINIKGEITILDGEKEITLPSQFYWGTDFVNGISLVRDKDDKIGVIDKNGNVIIPAQYKKMIVLSNNTIMVKKDKYYGILDLRGNFIFPPVFTSIKFVSNNRIRVEWDSQMIKPWNKSCHISFYSNEKYYSPIGDRSTLCNTIGEIVIDKNIQYVGHFTDKYDNRSQYTRIYKEVVRENRRLKLKQVGVIDFNGNIVINPIYDKIALYRHSYARLKKDGKYGIANLITKEIKMFENLNIKHIWAINDEGRCVFSEDKDCAYDAQTGDWIGGTRGVISMAGILIPSGKYQDIFLCGNGLIRVLYNGYYGLLDEKGKEILPTEYSYISSFYNFSIYHIYSYALICIGGVVNRISGKCGVVNDKGQIICQCEDFVGNRIEITNGEDSWEVYELLSQIVYSNINKSDEEDGEEIFKQVLSEKLDGIDEKELLNHFAEMDFHESDDEDLYGSDYASLWRSNLIGVSEQSILLYDEIPEIPINNESYDYCDDNDDGYSKYDGYNDWDDFTIDEAFDGNPELTWNID